MADVIFRQPLNMIEFILGAELLEFFSEATVIQGTASVFQVRYVYDDGTVEELTLFGSFGAYVDGVPTTGTVTGASHDFDGLTYYEISNMSISVEDFTDYVEADDVLGLFDDILDGADTMQGSSGDDLIGAFAGNDHMAGMEGDDVYFVEDAGDLVIEQAGQGLDTVGTDLASYTLPANVEQLGYLGPQIGAFTGIGNGGRNLIEGWDGNDNLDGRGGADQLAGFAGNDTYHVDTWNGAAAGADDLVVENPGAGTDTVRSSVSYALPANVENLLLTGTAALAGTGNSQANTITGNSGANRIDGGGNADMMKGGAGNDVYVVNTWSPAFGPDDQVIELAGEGNDKVESAVSYVLPAHVERLTLTGTALDGTGNSLANSISGNAAANRIDGGLGADTMRGNGGDDTFVVDNWSGAATGDDVVIELSGGGTDTVESSVSYRLPSHVENLILTGTAALNGTGNFHANAITGNDGANLLRGGDNADVLVGGLGNDRLYGGAGKDTLRGDGGADGYYFDSALSAAGNVDKLVGFNPAADTIFLDRDIFTQILANGTLAAAAFRAGPAAGDASDRIVYQQSTGKIFYDADGTGPEAQILFATVAAGTVLTSADFSAFI